MYDTSTNSIKATESSMRGIFAFILLVHCSVWVVAERYTLSGTVSDAATGETLPGASVAVEGASEIGRAHV